MTRAISCSVAMLLFIACPFHGLAQGKIDVDLCKAKCFEMATGMTRHCPNTKHARECYKRAEPEKQRYYDKCIVSCAPKASGNGSVAPASTPDAGDGTAQRSAEVTLLGGKLDSEGKHKVFSVVLGKTGLSAFVFEMFGGDPVACVAGSWEDVVGDPKKKCVFMGPLECAQHPGDQDAFVPLGPASTNEHGHIFIPINSYETKYATGNFKYPVAEHWFTDAAAGLVSVLQFSNGHDVVRLKVRSWSASRDPDRSVASCHGMKIGEMSISFEWE